MIHEVMVLDHSGPDFAFILYGAALKLWLIGTLLLSLVLPTSGILFLDTLLGLAALLLLALLVGVVESSMARLRLLRVRQLLVGAAALAALAFVLEIGGVRP
jgi:formate hydrogenlyase subunit 4